MLRYDGLSVFGGSYQYKTIIEPTNIHIADYPFNKFVWFDIDKIEFRGEDGVNKSINYADIVKKDQIPTVPTKTSQLTNDSGYITSSALTGYATESWVGQQGYQTASDVSAAVSTAISGQTKETLQFVLSDGTVVTKTFVLG